MTGAYTCCETNDLNINQIQNVSHCPSQSLCIGEDCTPKLTAVLLLRVVLLREPFGVLKEIFSAVEDEFTELVNILNTIRKHLEYQWLNFDWTYSIICHWINIHFADWFCWI
jgi:hypothetical protein